MNTKKTVSISFKKSLWRFRKKPWVSPFMVLATLEQSLSLICSNIQNTQILSCAVYPAETNTIRFIKGINQFEYWSIQ